MLKSQPDATLVLEQSSAEHEAFQHYAVIITFVDYNGTDQNKWFIFQADMRNGLLWATYGSYNPNNDSGRASETPDQKFNKLLHQDNRKKICRNKLESFCDEWNRQHHPYNFADGSPSRLFAERFLMQNFGIGIKPPSLSGLCLLM